MDVLALLGPLPSILADTDPDRLIRDLRQSDRTHDTLQRLCQHMRFFRSTQRSNTELISSITTEDLPLRMQHTADPIGYSPQHHIPNDVPELFIELTKVVDVQEENGDLLAIPQGGDPPIPQTVRPGEIGKRIRRAPEFTQ